LTVSLSISTIIVFQCTSSQLFCLTALVPPVLSHDLKYTRAEGSMFCPMISSIFWKVRVTCLVVGGNLFKYSPNESYLAIFILHKYDFKKRSLSHSRLLLPASIQPLIRSKFPPTRPAGYWLNKILYATALFTLSHGRTSQCAFSLFPLVFTTHISFLTSFYQTLATFCGLNGFVSQVPSVSKVE